MATILVMPIFRSCGKEYNFLFYKSKMECFSKQGVVLHTSKLLSSTMLLSHSPSSKEQGEMIKKKKKLMGCDKDMEIIY